MEAGYYWARYTPSFEKKAKKSDSLEIIHIEDTDAPLMKQLVRRVGEHHEYQLTDFIIIQRIPDYVVKAADRQPPRFSLDLVNEIRERVIAHEFIAPVHLLDLIDAYTMTRKQLEFLQWVMLRLADEANSPKKDLES